jgi:hypothetical protein
MTEINNNYFSPNKFQVVINRFPNVEFFAQDANIPGFTSGNVLRSTTAPSDYYEIGDKIQYNDFKIDFILDEDMETFKEIFNWAMMASVKKRKDFNPFSDITVIVLTNNSNRNFSFVVKNAFPYLLNDVDLSVRKSEDAPIVMSVLFKYSLYEIK